MSAATDEGPIADFTKQPHVQRLAVVDSTDEQLNKVLAALNSALALDPPAMHALLCNRVPVNSDFAERSCVLCEPTTVLVEERYSTGALGLVNGILDVLGLPCVAACIEQISPDNPQRYLVGFERYQPRSTTT